MLCGVRLRYEAARIARRVSVHLRGWGRCARDASAPSETGAARAFEHPQPDW